MGAARPEGFQREVLRLAGSESRARVEAHEERRLAEKFGRDPRQPAGRDKPPHQGANAGAAGKTEDRSGQGSNLQAPSQDFEGGADSREAQAQRESLQIEGMQR